MVSYKGKVIIHKAKGGQDMSSFIVGAENIRQQAEFITCLLNDSQKSINLYHIYSAPDSVKQVFKDCKAGLKYDARKVYRKLYIANLKAYNGRYRNHDEVKTFDKYEPSEAPRDKIKLYKHIQCYLYQCAEDPVYNTPIYKAVQDLKNSLAESIINDLPEYEAAKWG